MKLSFNGIKSRVVEIRDKRASRKRIQSYLRNGKEPWSLGYIEFRDIQINKALTSIPEKFEQWGEKLDERIVEIPWIFKNLSNEPKRLLDAGSTLNHAYILDHSKIGKKDLTIFTYFPESFARHSQRISYVYGDLRDLCFKDSWFEEIVCISTLEHIAMDNSIYGYQNESNKESNQKSFDYLMAVRELLRVLKNEGKLLLTFPFGKFENHGFFQQFDEQMVHRLTEELNLKGEFEFSFFRYKEDGWTNALLEDCLKMESHNPHTGAGKGKDGAAHSRAICCVSFIKKEI